MESFKTLTINHVLPQSQYYLMTIIKMYQTQGSTVHEHECNISLGISKAFSN